MIVTEKHAPREQTTFYTRAKTPIGPLLLVGEARGDALALSGIYFDDLPPLHLDADAREDAGRFTSVRAELEEYFAGERTAFDVPLAPRGTAFQQEVWRALTAIPYGETTTYSALAQTIGRPKAVRAVGAANGQNPISIVVPCHRVIGRDGTLTGYAGGLDKKRALLDLEARRTRR